MFIAHYCLGNALREKNQLDDAIREYRRTIELNSKYFRAHVNLGVVLSRRNRLDEAIEEYRKAIALDPKSTIAHKNLANALRDRIALCDGFHLFGTTALGPTFALAPQSLSMALEQRKHLDESIEEFGKVAALDPNDADARYQLGNLLRDKGRQEAYAHRPQENVQESLSRAAALPQRSRDGEPPAFLGELAGPSCVQQENDTSQTSSGFTHRTWALAFGRRLNGHAS
jgi:tetratricopeptide (TPR) repeat protein